METTMGHGVLEEVYPLIKDDLFEVYEKNSEVGGFNHEDPEKFIKDRIGGAKVIVRRDKDGTPLGFIAYKDEGKFIDGLNLAISREIRNTFFGALVAKKLVDEMEKEGKPIRLVILKVEDNILKLALGYGYKILGGDKFQLMLGKEIL